MSTEPDGPTGREGHGLRLAIGVLGGALIPFCMGDYVAVVIGALLAVVLNPPGAKAPSLRRVVLAPFAIWILGRLLAALLVPLGGHEDVVMVASCAAIFLCFYHEARNGPSTVAGLVLVLVVVLVPAGTAFGGSAVLLADTLGLGALAASIASFGAHVLVPAASCASPSAPATGRGDDGALRSSLGRTAVLTAVLAAWVLQDKTTAFYIPITVVLLLRIESPRTAGIGLLGANMIGGAIALLAAVPMQAVPMALFDLVLFSAMVLSLGRMAERGGALGAIAQQATSVAILLLVIAMLPTDATGAYLDRVGGIALTVIGVLLARSVFEAPAVSRPAGLPV